MSRRGRALGAASLGALVATLGVTGPALAEGANGADGADDAKGADGADGTEGPDGADGTWWVELGARAGLLAGGGGESDRVFAPQAASTPVANSAPTTSATGGRGRGRGRGRGALRAARALQLAGGGAGTLGRQPSLVGPSTVDALAGVWLAASADPADAVSLSLSIDTGALYLGEDGARPAAGTWSDALRFALGEAYVELGDPLESDLLGWAGKRRAVVARGYVYDARGVGAGLDWQRPAGPVTLAASVMVERPSEVLDGEDWRSPLAALSVRAERGPAEEPDDDLELELALDAEFEGGDEGGAQGGDPDAGNLGATGAGAPDPAPDRWRLQPSLSLFGAWLRDGDDQLASLVAGVLPEGLDGARLSSSGHVTWLGARAHLDAGPLALSALGAHGRGTGALTIDGATRCEPDGVRVAGALASAEARWYWTPRAWTGAFGLLARGHDGGTLATPGVRGLADLCAGRTGLALRGFPSIAPWFDEAKLALGGGLDATWRARGVRVAGADLRGARVAGARAGARLGDRVTLGLSGAWLRADGALPEPPAGEPAAGTTYGVEVDGRVRVGLASFAAVSVDGAWLHPGDFFADDSGEVWQVLAQLELWVTVGPGR